MVSEIQTKDISEANFSISLAPGGVGLANNTGRSSAKITNTNNYPAALVNFRIKSGSVAPTAGKAYFIYLLRDTGTIATDGWGGTDASFTPENAPVIGSIRVTGTANKNFYGDFDTAEAEGPLGPEWGVAVYNKSGQSISNTEGDHAYTYVYYIPEQQ